MCLLAGTLRIELRPSDLESLALTVTLYPEVSKTPRPLAWSFKNVALKIAARAFLTFYIYYIIKIIKSQNKMLNNSAGITVSYSFGYKYSPYHSTLLSIFIILMGNLLVLKAFHLDIQYILPQLYY